MPALHDHEFYVYNLELEYLAGFCGVNILDRLQASETFLVDTNASWKPLAQCRADLNFVLGCTIKEEADNIQGVLFSDMPDQGFSNAFSVTTNQGNGQGVVFNRIEPNFRACFSREIPRLPNTSAEHRAAQILAATSFRQHLSPYLDFNSEQLHGRLNQLSCRCLANYFNSGETAVIATAIYLQSCSQALRARKLDPGYLNFPGDSRLIAEALYFGFSIFSEDVRDVHELATILGIAVRKRADF